MSKNRYGLIYNHNNYRDARQFVGKPGVFSDYLDDIKDDPDKCIKGILNDAEDFCANPFSTILSNGKDLSNYFYFRPIVIKNNRLANLYDPRARKRLFGKLYRQKGRKDSREIVETIIFHIHYDGNNWRINGIMAEKFFKEYEEVER